MFFFKAKEDSLLLLKQCLFDFAALSGLVSFPAKSQVFSAGVDGEKKDSLLQVLGFDEGKLPIRYLRVPLSSRKMRVQDYEPLIMKITSLIYSCEARHLSYAGRLQLVKSVLFSLKIYWCQIFFLPKAVIDQVERLCKAYLWFGNAMDHGKVLVAWKHVCIPVKEGGLGVKDL